MQISNSQASVINCEKRNMLVSASAGSGKTFVLIERVVKQIVEKRIPLERLLIVTFTRAAASELKERIYIKLKKELLEAKEKKNQELVMFLSKQISKVSSSNISTIHSFCLNVIKSSFYYLGIDPLVTTLTNTKASMLLMDSITAIIDKEYEAKSESLYKMIELLQGEENLTSEMYKLYRKLKSIASIEEFEELSCQIYSSDGITDLSETHLGQYLFSSIKKNAQIMKLCIDNMVERIEGDVSLEKRTQTLKTFGNIFEQYVNAKTYDDMCKLCNLLNQTGDFTRVVNIDKQLNEEMKSLKLRASNTLKYYANLANSSTYEVIKNLSYVKDEIKWVFSFLNKVDELYTQKKKKLAVIDLMDYETLSYKALSNETIQNEFQDRFYEIYVDEYQDTSYMQEAIISKISNGSNIVMVGDVKQSIYRFRGAVPQIIMKKYDEFVTFDSQQNEPNVKIVMDTNYRSKKQIIDGINLVFEKIMSKTTGGSPYTAIESLKYGDLYPEEVNGEKYNKTTINIIEYNKNDNNQLKEEDAVSDLKDIEVQSQCICNRIQELVDNYMVFDKETNKYRKCEYKDIAILLATKVNVSNVLADILKQANIPAYDDSSGTIFEKNEVSNIISFFKILDNVCNDVALVSVMYSPIGQFTLDEMVKIRLSKKHVPYIYAIKEYAIKQDSDKSIVKKIERLLKLIDKYTLYIKIYSIAQTIVKLYNEIGIELYLEQNDYGKQKKACLDALVSIAKEYEKEESKSIYSFLKYIDSIKMSSEKDSTPQYLTENENVVRIMTIHHSKGLEFPCVFLANAQKYKNNKNEEKMLFNAEYGIGLNILREIEGVNITYPSIVNQLFKDILEKEEMSENIRLLYVALTRAREHLEIFATVTDFEKYKEKVIPIENDIVKEVVVPNSKSHFDYIIQALMSTNQENVDSLFELKCEKYESKQVEEATDKVVLNNTLSINQTMKQMQKKYNAKIIPSINKQMEEETYIYPYQEYLDLEQKYSVSKLKNQQEHLSQIEQLSPKCIAKDSNMDFGSMMHAIMERIDLTGGTTQDISELIDNLGYTEKKSILCNMIKKILNSKVKEMAKNSKKIWHEYEFVLKSDLADLPQVAFPTQVLIQGIIDLLILNQDGTFTIIDYKTDRVEHANQLLDKYAIQLKIYKKGIEGANNKVKDMYIYSFTLDELIEVK